MTTKWVPLVRSRVAEPGKPEISRRTVGELIANFDRTMYVYQDVVDACGEPAWELRPSTNCYVTQVKVAEHEGAPALMALINGPEERMNDALSFAYFPQAKHAIDGKDIGARLDAIYFAATAIPAQRGDNE